MTTLPDEELGFPGNREIVEHALRVSTTQVLHLSPPQAGPRHRSLLERTAEAVRGVELLPPASASTSTDAIAVARKDGISADLAEDYLRAKTEVKAILAQHLNETQA
jgi:hypothetical protein